MVKNLPTMQDTWVQSLGWEDPQEKGKAIHSSIFAWRIPWTEEYGGLQLMDMTEQLTQYFTSSNVRLSLRPLPDGSCIARSYNSFTSDYSLLNC